MKRYLYLSLVLLLSFFACTVLATTQAQEAQQEEEEIAEYAYGTAVKASGNQLTILEYDYDSDVDIEVTYMLDPNAEIQNVSSIKDIAAGDYVEVVYVVKGGKKTAKVIAVEKETAQGPQTETEEETTVDVTEDIEY